MKLRDLNNRVTAQRVLGVDASTKSYAWCLLDGNEVVETGEREFGATGSLYKRMVAAQEVAEHLASLDAEFCAIEQIVFVNNRSVAIKLGYFCGILMGALAGAGVPFDDVAPMTWMNYIENGNLTKEERLKIKRDTPGKSKNWYKDRGREMRKQRTIDWAAETYGVSTDSDNVADAIGVAHYAQKEMTNG